jgi:Na+-transporting NADH:ubiquinone oxidoreductase subunit C
MTIVVGGLLSFTSQFLAPAQKKSVELDTKTQILGAVQKLKKGDSIIAMYNKRIRSLAVDFNGDEVTTNLKGGPMVVEEVNILKNYKKDPKDRVYPVFMYMNEQDPSKVEAYILPLYGAGLWDKIWGFAALDSNLETIVGVAFDHKAETPGLGARIKDAEVRDRYVGKKIYDVSGAMMSVSMLKGEGNANLNEHQVDGLSGATLTANGVNSMMKQYLQSYQAYFEKVKAATAEQSELAYINKE